MIRTWTQVAQRKEMNYKIDIPETMDIIFGAKGEKISKEYRAQIANDYFNPQLARKELHQRHAA